MIKYPYRLGALFILLGQCALAHAEPLACLIEPEKVAEIGAPSIGIINRIPVERGDYVRAGQVLVYMRAEVETASRNVAASRAKVEAELLAASAAADLAEAKVKRSRDLVKVGFISKEALDQSETELRIAKNRVVQTEEARVISQNELDLSNSVLSQRSIRAPFAGLVMDRYRNEGERIEREPVVRVAKVDPLRVEVVLPVSQYGQIKLGDLAAVKTEIADVQGVKATVVLVDRMVDAASNTFRVRLALPNPDHRIPPGLRCSIAFEPAAREAAPLPVPAPLPGIAAAASAASVGGVAKSPVAAAGIAGGFKRTSKTE